MSLRGVSARSEAGKEKKVTLSNKGGGGGTTTNSVSKEGVSPLE
jgi:hypothetical protein